MNKSSFLSIFGIYPIFLSSLAFGQAPQLAKCPAFKGDSADVSWRITNVATHCRAHCETNADCISVQDKCGRVVFSNKIYKSEIESFINSGNYSCPSSLQALQEIDSVCERKKCEPAFKSCEVQIRKQNDYLASKAVTECAGDSDCSFVSVPNEKCIQRLPISRASDLPKISLDIQYLRDAVLSACKMKNVKECSPIAKSYCISKECLVLQERPPFKNFVNFEGASSVPNFASNTNPIKMPRASQSKCAQDSECAETTGVCSQYAVSINKKFLASFKADVEKMEKSIACPTTDKIQVPKSRCFKEFCSFVN